MIEANRHYPSSSTSDRIQEFPCENNARRPNRLRIRQSVACPHGHLCAKCAFMREQLRELVNCFCDYFSTDRGVPKLAQAGSQSVGWNSLQQAQDIKSVFVLRTIGVSGPIGDLMQLCHQQRCRPSDAELVDATVGFWL